MVADQWLGAELAGYRIDAVVGRGGAGVVYRATHLRLQRPAAVKLLAPALAADAEYRRRFEREARLAAALEHPHIVPIYDAGYAEGVLYLAMAYIDGPNLASAIENNGTMDLQRLCVLLTGVAEALDGAHHAGLVHRDVKPANVLLTVPGHSSGRAYLCDFGIARHTSSTSALTTSGQFLGTLQYCAPEQIQGRPIDGRTDQYALACVVYHCLTGRAPYAADEPSAVMFAHVSADPPRASEHVLGLPEAVDDVIARALAKQPEHRFADCATFLQALAAADTAASTAPDPVPATPHTVIWPPNPHQPAPRPPSPAPPAPARRLRPYQMVILALCAVAVLAAVGVGVIHSSSTDVVAAGPAGPAAAQPSRTFPASPAPPPPPAAPIGLVPSQVPGWVAAVSTARNVAYDVPPPWTPYPGLLQTIENADGSPAAAMSGVAEYQTGDPSTCPPDSGGDGYDLASSGVTGSHTADTAAAARAIAERWTGAYRRADGSMPQAAYSAPRPVTVNVQTGSHVVADVTSPPGECGSPRKAVHAIAVPDGKGQSIVLVLLAERDVPGALTDADVDRIAATLRPAGLPQMCENPAGTVGSWC